MRWMKLEPIIQSELSQKEKQQYSILPGAIMGDPTHDEVMKKIPDTQGHSGYKGPSRLASASTPPCVLPTSLLLFLFVLLQILVLPAESSPAPLSLNKDQLKTLINKSPDAGTL